MKILAAALALTTCATTLHAQVFEGGEFTLNTYNWGSYSGNFGTASAVTNLGSFGLQFDASVYKYTDDDPEEIQASIGVHAFRDVSDSLRVGVVGVFEEWSERDGSDYIVLGIEAAYSSSTSPLSVEFFIGQETATTYDYTLNVMLVEATYEVSDSFALTAGFRTISDYYDETFMSVGAKYSFDNGFAIGAEFVNLSNGDQAFGLTLSKSFGTGAAFSQRSWEQLTLGW